MKISALHLLALSAAGLFLLAANAAPLPSGAELGPNGIVNIAGMNFQPILFGTGFKQTNLTAKHADLLANGDTVQAQTSFTGGKMKVVLTAEGKDSFDYDAEVKFDRETEILGLMLSVIVPETGKLLIPGKKTDFPPYDPKRTTLLQATCKTLSIVSADGKRIDISGDITARIIDRRGKGAGNFELRLYFSPNKGKLLESGLKLKFTVDAEAQAAKAEATDEEYVTAPGKDWIELESARDVVPGSPLDFSDQLDAPAGKYGRVIVNGDGHFAFEKKKDTAVRFVGTNLCFTAQYLDKPEADALADRLARMGYNAVRIHHYDKYLVDLKAPDSLTIDRDNLDKLDYLIYALKKRGIYITTDIYVSRIIKAGDGIPEFVEGAGKLAKALLPISEKMRENWKTFAREWLTHRNPYTGLSLVDDPVLYSIGLTNENNIYACWNLYPKITARYDELFREWQKKQNPEAKIVAVDPNNRLFREFLYELQENYTLELRRYLKDELKVKALLSDLNMDDRIPLTVIRNQMDIVDDHKYHDHPKFPGKPFQYPFSFRQESAISGLGHEVPGRLFPARIFEKPYSVTEYRYCTPNRFRMEGGALLGSYAAFQGWDALYQFAWAHSKDTVMADDPIGSFNGANDLLAQLSDRLIMFLFRRHDATAAREGVALRVAPDFWAEMKSKSGFVIADEYSPVKFRQLGLITKVGMVVGDPQIPGVELISKAQAEGALPLQEPEIEKRRKEMFQTGIARSMNGELSLDSKANVFTATTPRSEVLSAVEGTHQVGALNVSGIDTPTTVAACSLDGRDLGSSSRILIFHLTDVCDSGIRFKNAERKVILSAGQLPHLLRRSKLEISLKLLGDGPVTVYALKNNGGTHGRVTASFSGETLKFSADNSSFPGGVMVYLVERQTN